MTLSVHPHNESFTSVSLYSTNSDIQGCRHHHPDRRVERTRRELATDLLRRETGRDEEWETGAEGEKKKKKRFPFPPSAG